MKTDDREGKQHDACQCQVCLLKVGHIYRLKPYHQSKLIYLVDESGRYHVRIPRSRKIQDGDGGEQRLGNGGDYPEEDSGMAQPVNPGGFQKFIRHCEEKLSCHKQEHCLGEERQCDCPDCVMHVQFRELNVHLDHSKLKRYHHREQQAPENNFFPGKWSFASA